MSYVARYLYRKHFTCSYDVMIQQVLLDCEGDLKEKEEELRDVITQLEKVKSVAEKYVMIHDC